MNFPQKVDLLRVENLTSLKFREEHIKKCHEWFAVSLEDVGGLQSGMDQDAQRPNANQDQEPEDPAMEGGFHIYYKQMVEDIVLNVGSTNFTD